MGSLADDINRAAAIRICATAASTPGFVVDYGWSHIYGASEPAWELALAAYLAANESSARWADAEAMLRSGWTP